MPGKDAPAHQALYDGALAGALAAKYHCTTQQDDLTMVLVEYVKYYDRLTLKS